MKKKKSWERKISEDWDFFMQGLYLSLAVKDMYNSADMENYDVNKRV